jgi:hypothetical protein
LLRRNTRVTSPMTSLRDGTPENSILDFSIAGGLNTYYM